jgi:putative aminophosphonate oxidoreductase
MRPFWLEQALGRDGEDLLPALQGAQQADLVIVGGGFTGLWSAIRCKQQNPALDIVLVEADLCGAGASGRNGGCVLSWSGKFFTLCRLFGEQEAVRLVRESEAAVGHIGAFCREHQIDCEFRMDGTLYTATNRVQLHGMDQVIAALQRHGVNSWQHLPPHEVARRAGSSIHLAGVFSGAAATLQPGKLVRGLRRVALAMGVRIHERSPMQGFARDPASGQIKLQTPFGSVRAKQMVLAINAWMASSLPQLQQAFERSIAVVSSDMIITERCPQLLAQCGLQDGVSVLDSRIFVYYYRSTPDGRLMLGKGGNTFAWKSRVLPLFDQISPYAASLTEGLQRFFPALCDVPICASWNGPSDRSVSGFPFFGRFNGAPNIFYGFGYSGNGVGPSYMGGQILSSLVLGQDNAWSRSPLCQGPLGLFPPEPLRYVGAHLVRNAIRRKERAEDEERRVGLYDRFMSGFAAAAGKADKPQ